MLYAWHAFWDAGDSDNYESGLQIASENDSRARTTERGKRKCTVSTPKQPVDG